MYEKEGKMAGALQAAELLEEVNAMEARARPLERRSFGAGGMALFSFFLFAVAGLAFLERYVELALRMLTLSALGPAVHILCAAYLEGKREEARGRVEAARASLEGGEHERNESGR
jgi:hypothetical protein